MNSNQGKFSSVNAFPHSLQLFGNSMLAIIRHIGFMREQSQVDISALFLNLRNPLVRA